MNYFLVFIGGGLGSALRYLFHVYSEKLFGTQLPIGTFISNLASCLVLIAFVQIIRQLELESNAVRLLVLVGFCGGFSTFSTFSYETTQLIKNGNHLVAAGNVIVSVSICLILIYKLTK